MKNPPSAAAALCVILAAACPGAAQGRSVRGHASRLAQANSSPAAQASPRATAAPSGLPLVTSGQPAAVQVEDGGSARAEADPLVSNGLGSPACGQGPSRLASAVSRNCETSGFVAAAAPTGDYGIDIHIDTGLLGVNSGALLSAVQTLLLTPLWMALVWLTHALVVMLEWAFSIDLLGDRSAEALRGLLSAAERAITLPLLALALAVASMFAVYHGVVRRRVADTIGELLLTVAMLVGGLWLIVDPTDTAGLLSGWSEEAGLGTLAVAATGSPTSPSRTLGESLVRVFAVAVEAPWCYLEFGDVRWCREPARAGSPLRVAASRIAEKDERSARCSGPACSTPDGASSHPLAVSARLLREARSNGGLFLALPANGPARNSINESGSLLRALCQSTEATNCHGPTASQAEFRTDAGTWPRVGGLLLISGGLLGLLLLLGNLAIRLLMATIFSVFYLLLAPGLVIAPAFGEGGRRVFRTWLGRLFGAIGSKLVLAFLLGAVLGVMALIEALSGLGWWTQWLLLSAFWWGVFARRHQLLTHSHASSGHGGRMVAMRLADRLDPTRHGARVLRRRELPPPTPPASRGIPRREAPRTKPGDVHVERLLGNQGRGVRIEAIRERAGERARQLERIEQARDGAAGVGDSRRAAILTARAERVREQLEQDRRLAEESDRARANRGEQGPMRARQAAFLEEQAGRPSARRKQRGTARRDYAGLAGIVGYGRAEYEALDPGTRRAARLEIDRELAARDGSEQADRERLSADELSTAARLGISLFEADESPAQWAGPESEVTRDLREVAAGRKRQLGIGKD
jgi:hypothetical protein